MAERFQTTPIFKRGGGSSWHRSLILTVLLLLTVFFAQSCASLSRALLRNMQPELKVTGLQLLSIDASKITVRILTELHNHAPVALPATRFNGTISVDQVSLTTIDTPVPSIRANGMKTFPFDVSVPLSILESQTGSITEKEVIPISIRGSARFNGFSSLLASAKDSRSGGDDSSGEDLVLSINETKNIPAIVPEIRIENLKVENPLESNPAGALTGWKSLPSLKAGFDLIVNNKAGGRFQAEDFNLGIRLNGYDLMQLTRSDVRNFGRSSIVRVNGELSPRALGSSLLRGISGMDIDYSVRGDFGISFPEYDFKRPLTFQFDRSGDLGIE